MKSQMLLLVQRVLTEVGTWCRVCTDRDLKTITARVEGEGLSFLTITLPAFCGDLQKGLSEGKVGDDLFSGFRKRGGLPLFLGGFLRLIFDDGTGVLLDEPDVDAILAVRQVCLLYSKVLLPCSDTRQRAALSGYIRCEQEVRDADAKIAGSPLLEDFARVAHLLWAQVLTQVDLAVYKGDLVPKHGPGATADKLRGNAKFQQVEWPVRLERALPAWEMLLPNQRHMDRLDRLTYLEPGDERPAKVILVPKTLKTPRVIAVEPTAMQYAQQGLMECLVNSIEHDEVMGSMVRFRDQVSNQHLARIGSSNGSLATLDLSEASDRVSNQHVLSLLSKFPHASEVAQAVRSRKVDVPGHGVKRVAKYASMGSALTFPLEAMVFTTIIFMAIEKSSRSRLTRKAVNRFSDQVRVYGDDIIVPVEYAEAVSEMLDTFGYRVNLSKSFWTGKFRESCGKEYYDGTDVSVVRVRRVFPTRLQHVPEIVSTVSLMNQMYFAGLWGTAKTIEATLEELIPLPVVLPSSPVLGKHSYTEYATQRLCRNLHRPLVKGYVVTSRLPASELDGSDALLKWFLKRGSDPFADKNHLGRAGRPESVDIKLRWAPSF